MEPQTENGRPLGSQEQLLHGLHRWGALIAAQVLHVSGDLDPEMVGEALSRIQRRHPLLRSHIVYGPAILIKEFPYIVRPPIFRITGTQAIPLSVIERCRGRDWEELLKDELDRPLPIGNHPRVRATLVRDRRPRKRSELVLTFDHAIVDAQAVNLLSRELMRIFEGSPESVMDGAPSARQLPPPLESRLAERSNSGAAPYTGPIRLPLPPCRRPGQRRTGVQVRTLGRGQTLALYQACRRNGATLHGAVCSAALKTLSGLFSTNEMTCLSTVDLRRLCSPKVSDRDIGCYVDILRTRHDVAGDFWSLARDVCFTLISRIAKDQDVSSVLKVPALGRLLHEGLGAIWNSGRTDGLAVSSVGDTGLVREYGRFTLERVTMAVSLHVRGPGLFILAFEHDGELNLSFCHAIPVMTDETASMVADRTAGLLHGIG